MKYNPFFFLCLSIIAITSIFFASCRQKIPFNQLQKRDGIYYAPGEKKAFTGIAFGKYPNGQESYFSLFHNGKREGKTVSRYKNGQKKLEAEFKNGKLDGHWIQWYENGVKKAEIQFKKGKEHGQKILWYENSVKQFEVRFREGKYHGRLTGWDKQGQIRYQIQCRESKPHGKYLKWYANGNRKEQGMCSAGKPQGIWTRWYRNGKKKEKIGFKGGNRHGKQARWYENGSKQFLGEWHNGKPCGKWLAWSKDGHQEDFQTNYFLKGLYPNNQLIPQEKTLDKDKRSELNFLQKKTLQSLRKIDNYPLYVMEYFGSYGFEEFLTTGLKTQGDWFGNIKEDIEERRSCTTIAALNRVGNSVLLGSNMDWRHSLPLILFTYPPGAFASLSMVTAYELINNKNHNNLEQTPLLERMGLLKVPYYPHSGINECGLAIAEMAVFDGKRAWEDPLKVTLNGNQMTRLVLDYAKNVDEAIALFKNYNNSSSFGIHYLIADSSGKSVIIEYNDHKLNVIRNREPWQVATNFSVAFNDPEKIKNQCWRYKEAYNTLKKFMGNVSITEAMKILENVSVTDGHITQWSVVYKLATSDVHVSVGQKYKEVKKFKIKK